MADTPQSGLGLSLVELLLHEQRYEEALAALAKLIEENPSNRQIRIYRLLAVRIILLRQALTRSISQPINASSRMLPERFSTPAKALQDCVTSYATQWLRWSRQRRQPWLARKLAGRAALALMGLALLIIRITPSVTHGFRWVCQAIRPVLARDILRSAALVAAAVGLLVTPITAYVSGSLGVTKEGISDVQKEPLQAPVQNNYLAIDASENNPRARTPEIDEQGLYNLVANQLSNVRGMYGRWIEKNQNLTGSLLLKLTVDSSGKVTRVDDLGSSLSDAGFVDAVMKEARKWRFPENNTEAAEIIIPLLLIPEAIDPATVEIWRRAPRTSKPSKQNDKTSSSDSGADKPAIKPKPSVSDSKPGGRNQRNPQFAREVETIYKTRHSLSLREEPRFASASLQQIDGGTHISILGTQGDWLKVRTQHSSAIGFLRKEFVIPANTVH